MKVVTVVCLTAALHCVFAISLVAESKSVTNKPFKFEDSFETDSRAEYIVGGEVQWNSDRFTLGEKSAIAKRILSGPRFSIELEMRPTTDATGLSVTRLNFSMTNGFEVVIGIARLKKGDTYQAQLEIAQIRKSGDGASKTTLLRRIPIAVSATRSELWQVEFDFGVVHVSIDEQSYGTSYTESDGVWCASVAISSDKGSVDLARLSIAGNDPTMSPAQTAAYRQTQKNNSRASKIPTEELTEWLKLKRANIELMREAFGERFYAIGFEHQEIGYRLDALGKKSESVAKHEFAGAIFSEALGADHPRTLVARIYVGEKYVEAGDVDRGFELMLPNLAQLLRVAGTKGPTPQSALICTTNALSQYETDLRKKQEYGKCLKVSRQLLVLLKIQYENDPTKFYWQDQQTKFLEQLYEATGKQRQGLIEIDEMTHRMSEKLEHANPRETLDMQLELLSLRREHLGPRHLLTLDLLGNISVGSSNLGEFGASLLYANEAVDGFRSVVGVVHPVYASSLVRLASSYSTTQRYQEATPLFDEALEILGKAGDKWDSFHAIALLERGRHRRRLNELSKSEKDLAAAQELFVKIGMEASSFGLTALEGLTNIYRARGNISKSSKMLDKRRDLALKHFGRDSQEFYGIALEYAIQAQEQGKPEVAKERYAEARKLAIRYYGRYSRVFDAVIGSELDFFLAQRDSARAGEILQELIEFQRQRREALFDVSSTSEQFSRSLIDQDTQNRVMNVAMLKLLSASDAYQMVLATKGAVAKYQRRQAFIRRDPELKPDVDRLRAISTRLTNRGTPLNAGKDAIYIQLSNERLQIQRRIATHARKSTSEHQRTTPSTICRSLEPGSVVIDYVEYYTSTQPLLWGKPQVQRRMAAFVYAVDREVELIELGISERIEKRWHRWFESMADELAAQTPDDSLSAQRTVDAAGIELRKLILDPILHGHPPPKALVVSPAGCLNLCPFAAIPVRRDGTLLIEALSVSYTLAAQLIDDSGIERSRSDDASLLMVGDIDYGQSLFGTQNLVDPLPAAEEELDPLRAAFERKYADAKIVSLLGTDANEIRVRGAVSKARFVHISTHGFCVDSSTRTGTETNGQPHFVSGIALADANSAISRRSSLGGILWDDEIATLDWTNADLVVLSACQTALGNVRPGEGMQGLHRALAVGGAVSSITTLWTVQNRFTIELMNRFYQGLLDEDLTKSEALRHAKIEMLRSYDWRGDEESGSERCPIALWAPFVLYGDQ